VNSPERERSEAGWNPSKRTSVIPTMMDSGPSLCSVRNDTGCLAAARYGSANTKIEL
jgi:hypothetical protein